MNFGPMEERVVYRERFQARNFDFRGKSSFTRFDGCEFVKCTLLKVQKCTNRGALSASVKRLSAFWRTRPLA
jgi:hypothetical protein